MPTKRHFAILAAVLTIVACTPARAPSPGSTTAPAPGTMPETRTGGPCGDGTILRPNEQCP